MTDTEIKFEYRRKGLYSGVLTLRSADQVLYMDTITDIGSAVARENLAVAVNKRCPGVQCEIVEAELLRLADLNAPRNSGEDETGEDEESQADKLGLVDFEPWPEPVDGAELLTKIEHTFRRFAVLPPHGVEAVALWCLYSHVFDRFDVSPILTLRSPSPRCGKTTLLSLICGLVPRALPASNVTAATLFRIIEAARPVLLIDEAETLFTKEAEELRGIVNSGHTRAAARVIRCTTDKHKVITVTSFKTYAPKCLALIGKLPPTLEDRSVVVPMRRKTKADVVDKLRLMKVRAVTFDLGRMAARWALDHGDEIEKSNTAIPDMGNDRAEDNWEVLLAVADACGGDWPARSRQAAAALTGAAGENPSVGELLLFDLRAIFNSRAVARIPTADILADLSTLEERPWSTYGRQGRGLSAQDLGRLLRPFGVMSKNLKIDGRSPKGYTLQDLEDPFSRYLPSEDSAAPLPASDSKENSGKVSATCAIESEASAAGQCSEKTGESLPSSGVAEKPQPGEWKAAQHGFRFALDAPEERPEENLEQLQSRLLAEAEEKVDHDRS